VDASFERIDAMIRGNEEKSEVPMNSFSSFIIPHHQPCVSFVVTLLLLQSNLGL
jgi:hypothetical protein